jgi:cytochrome c oxidase assembly protein subunit 15
MALAVPGLGRVALRATTRLFVCNQCLRQAPRTAALVASTTSPLLNVARFRSFGTSRASAQSSATLGKLAQEASARPAQQQQQDTDSTTAKSKGFPKTSSKSVAYWLLGSAASVFGIVVFGGLTRLTESG